MTITDFIIIDLLLLMLNQGDVCMCERNYCGQCKSFIRFYCPKWGKYVSYSGKVCHDFERKREVK